MIITRIFAAIRQWKRYRDTFNELSRLSDRELADLGIFRADIQRLSWDSARGA